MSTSSVGTPTMTDTTTKKTITSWKGFEKERSELIRLGTIAKKLDEDNEDIPDEVMFQETIECLKDPSTISEFSDFAAVGREIERLGGYCVFELNIDSRLVYKAWSNAMNK
jgi:hypothetical protein